MIYVKKTDEPEWFTEFKSRNPKADYDSESFAPFRKRLLEHLVEEQHGLCAYCCCRITKEKAHNEHIEPRHPSDGVSRRSLDYQNIVASCNRKRTCGSKKGNNYDKNKFVSPVQPECEGIFSYFPNGEIDGDRYTIELLGLDEYELNKAREAVYKQIMNLDCETIELIYCSNEDDLLNNFENVIRWYLKTHR